MDMFCLAVFKPATDSKFFRPLSLYQCTGFFEYAGRDYLYRGPGSVRAYRPSESSGDRGYFASAELRSDLANWQEVTLPDWLPSIQPYAFVDHVNAREVYGKARRTDKWSGYGWHDPADNF